MKLGALGLAATLLFIILAAALLNSAAGSQVSSSGSIKLLAVRESAAGMFGSVADLSLEIQPGKGRVFIQTFPLTKLDTQISTRFAKELACSLLEKDCSQYDFIYTIRSDSSLVGGPSAGAAAAVLTTAVLSGKQLNQSIAMTGTINSGYIIGPVGGVKEKVEAAFDAGIRKVMIPKGDRYFDDGNITYNKSIDLVSYGKDIGMQVVEVEDLRQAFYEFTGISISPKAKNLEVDKSYSEIMGMLGELLCNRTAKLQEDVAALEYRPNSSDAELVKRAYNLTSRGNEALASGQPYSAASYCYGANTQYRTILLRQANMTAAQAASEASRLKGVIQRFSDGLAKREITTVTELQAYMIVQERLENAIDNLDRAMQPNITDTSAPLAYATERVYSAVSWSYFFDMPGKKFNLNEAALSESCSTKISEAQERIHYVNLFLPEALEGPKSDVDSAYSFMRNKSFELCLFTASKAKAEADAVLTLIGADSEQALQLIDDKMKAAQRAIAEQASKGTFPILAYSYYEYAGSLRGTDAYSSLLYLEYALEMSNIDIYFKESSKPLSSFKVDRRAMWLLAGALLFIAGIAAGAMLVSINPRKCPGGHLRGKKR